MCVLITQGPCKLHAALWVNVPQNYKLHSSYNTEDYIAWQSAYVVSSKHIFFISLFLERYSEQYCIPHSHRIQYRIISLFDCTEWSCQLCFQSSCLRQKLVFLNDFHWQFSCNHFWIFCSIFIYVEHWMWIHHKHSRSFDKFQRWKVFIH